MITERDLAVEKLFREAGDKPIHSNATHTIRFDRDIYYYNKDEIERQKVLAARIDTRVTYEDHIAAVRTARHVLGKETQAEIAMCILSHRYFKDYRAKAFKGTGSFREDFAFVVSKVDNIIDHRTAVIITPDTHDKVKHYKEPTLVQVNHLVGTVEDVKVSTKRQTLQQWASKFNAGAPESTTYVVAGRKL